MSRQALKNKQSSAADAIPRAIVPFFAILMALNFLDRTNVGFAALRMNAELGFSPQIFGFGAGLLSMGEALFAVPSGLAAQRAGVHRWIAVLVLSWSAVAAAMSALHTASAFFGLRFLLGAAEAGVLPCISAYVSAWIMPAQRGRALALISAGSAVAAVIGGPLAGWLFKLNGRGGLAGWRWLFLCESLPAMAAGIIAWRWLPALPRATSLAESESESSGVRGLIELITQRPAILVMGVINLCVATCVISSLLWFPLMIAEVPGLTIMQVGWITAAVFFCGALGMIVVGSLSDRTGWRFRFLVLCLALAPLAYLFAAWAESPVARLTALGFGTALLRSTAGDFFVGATERMPSALRSSGMGLLAACGGIGGFLGPTLFGVLRGHTGNYSMGMIILSGVMLVGSALGVYVARDFHRISVQAQAAR